MRYGKLLIGLAAFAMAGTAFAQDSELAAKERAVQAVTSRPATWAARSAEFRAWLAAATDDEGKPLSAGARNGHITDQIHTLDKELERARGITAATTQAAILGDICLAKWLAMGCKAPAAGILRGDDGTRILWQLQSGSSEEDGIGMGVMLWDGTRAGAPRLIGWTFEGVYMEAPRYSSENQLLWVTGRMTGTGDGNADILYQKQAGKWVEIDTGSWQAEAARRLPDGIGIWHGADYDLTSLTASTELWKDRDANCCATGGRANLDFEIVGNTLKLKGISAQLGGPANAWKDY
ncbi:MAG: hypothetical protein V4808_06355 [Pseudomonadota bacterium]